MISESMLSGLPLNGRSYSQLATLEAGVSDSSSSSASRGTGGGNLSMSGSRSTSNNFLIDGTNIMNAENGMPRSAAGVQLGSDAVMQVQVHSAGYSAEYGRSSGGVMNSITRSGSNDLHGMGFWYLRNSKLDARNFFDREANPPPFKRNQFGGSVSGAIARERSFFLVSYEGLRDRLTETIVSFWPDAAARLGDLGPSRPRVAVAPSVLPYLHLMPVPNDRGEGGGVGRHVAPQALPTSEDYLTTRLDHKLSDRDSLFVRYTIGDAEGEESQGSHLFRTVAQTRQQYLTTVGTRILNLRSLVSFRFGYTRPSDTSHSEMDVVVPESLYFLPNAPMFGQITIPGLSAFGPTTNIPRSDGTDSFQFGSHLIRQQGAHALKLGADFHRYRWDVYSDWQKGAQWAFNNLEGFLQAGPVGTSLFVALPGSENHRLFRQNLFALYVQDEYRLSSRLQLSMGLRYELAGKIIDELGRNVFLRDLWRDSVVQYGDYYSGNPNLKNFSPRLGFTWSPWENRQTVLSAGAGIYYDPILGYVGSSRRTSDPFYKISVNPNLNTANIFPNALSGPVGGPYLVQVMDYDHIHAGVVYRYNLTLQQPLPGGWRMQASYVGSRGNHLLRRFEANQFPLPLVEPDGSLLFPQAATASPVYGINPAFGSITLINSDAQSFYNALQVSGNKALGDRMSVQASYTYSRSVDDSSVGQTTNTGQYGWDRTMDRALSDFDIRQRLSVSYFLTLPFGGSQPLFNNGAAGKILGGWRLGGIVSLRNGTPFSAGVNVRYAGYLFQPQRPNLIPGGDNNPISGASAGCGLVAAGTELGTPEQYFDPCQFAPPQPGRVGTAGRNTLIAPSIFGMDLSVQRDFLLDSKRRLNFRADLFNVPNHPIFRRPRPPSSPGSWEIRPPPPARSPRPPPRRASCSSPSASRSNPIPGLTRFPGGETAERAIKSRIVVILSVDHFAGWCIRAATVMERPPSTITGMPWSAGLGRAREEPREAARRWMARNQSVVDEWFKE